MKSLAVASLAVTVFLAPLGVALGVIGELRGLDFPADRESALPIEVVVAAVALLYGAVGYLISRRRPDNAIGWIFLASAPLFALLGVLYAYADLSRYGDEGWPIEVWVAWFANWVFFLPVFVAPLLVAQLFPDGRPVSPRWRWLLWATVAAVLVQVTSGALRAAPLDPYPDVANPAGLTGAVGRLLETIWSVGDSVAPPFFALAAVASLVVRFRRSRGVERQQLKWLAFAGVVFVAAFAIAGLTQPSVVSDVFFVLAILALAFIPVAVGIAILRYRLYEIDRVISRTVVYATVTIVLGAAYAGLVLASQALFSSFAGGSDLAIAISTLVVAALFLPVRTRVQRFVDRRFYRRRYDAQQTLEAFGVRLRDQIELDALARDLRGVVGETMQPVHASLWLRTGARG